MSDPYNEGPAAADARRRRNLAILIALVAFCALIFTVTVVRMGQASVANSAAEAARDG